MRPEPLREEIQTLREKWGCSDPGLYGELSDLLFKAGKIRAALNLVERGLNEEAPGALPEAGPDDGTLWFRRGLEYADACLYEEALASLGRALEAGCENFETHYCLAGVCKSLGRLEEADRHCRKSLEYNPAFAPAHILFGSILKLSGRYSDSAAAAKKALLIDPDCAPAHYDLACYYALGGDPEKALVALEMALAKGFCDFDWLARDPDLSRVHALPAFRLLLQTYNAK